MTRLTAKQVLAAIGEPHLNLVNGGGYWYFIYDDDDACLFDTHSVYTMHLNNLSLDAWVTEGKEAIRKAKHEAR